MMPYSAPSSAALMVCRGGICHTTIASRIDSASPTSEAFHALTRKTPRRMNSVTRGITATSAERNSDPNTGSRICWNMGLSFESYHLWASLSHRVVPGFYIVRQVDMYVKCSRQTAAHRIAGDKEDPMPKVAAVSIIDAVSEDLRRRVLSGELEPETPLAEVEVADSYQVARPTAKAAIENLVRERLLERSAHKTARVVRLAPEDARDIYRARAIIESEVLRRLAADRRVPDAARVANAEIAALADASPREIVEPDMRFHRSLVDALASARTSMVYDSLASEVVFCMSQVQGASLLPTSTIVAEHDRLLELIAQGEGDAAAAAPRRASRSCAGAPGRAPRRTARPRGIRPDRALKRRRHRRAPVSTVRSPST